MSRVAIEHPPFLQRFTDAPAIGFARAAEAGLCILFICMFSQGLIGPVFASSADPESSAILRLMWLPVYAVTLVMIAARPGATFRVIASSPLLVGLVVLTMVSVLWSLAPDVTLRRSFALIMTSLFGFWFAARWSWRDAILIIATSFFILAILSVIFALAIPSIGVDHAVHAGAWKGIWWEKNTLGAMMAWGSVSALAAAQINPERRWTWRTMAVLCTALVLLSTSKTALLAWVLGVGGIAGIGLCRQGFGFAAMTLCLSLTGAVLAGMALLIAPIEALELLGRDATLTGRTDIWGVLLDQIRAAPWTGYGYRAYWVAETGPVFWVRQETAWDVPTAHNGWLETALAIGLPGVALLVMVYFRALARGLSHLFSGQYVYFVLPWIAMLGLVSISESNFLQQNGLSWTLFVFAAAKLADRRAR